MNKKLLTIIFMGLFNTKTLAEISSLASNIEAYLTKKPNISTIYHVATPNKVLAQGPSSSLKSKNKQIIARRLQIQTIEITKTMTAAAIMLLHEQNKLRLNDPIIQHIPAHDWPNSQPPAWANQATIHHLLSHRTGMASYRYNNKYYIDFDAKIDEQTFKRKVLGYAANKVLFYGIDQVVYASATDYFILGMIIENISKQPLNVFFKENLFKPLDMHNTFLPSFKQNLNDLTSKDKQVSYKPLLPFGDGGVVSAVEDIYKWNMALHTMKIVSKASYDQMTQAHSAIDTCCQFSDITLNMLKQLGYKEPCAKQEWVEVNYGYGLYIIPLASNRKEILYCISPESYFGEEAWYLPTKNISIVLATNQAKPEEETMNMTSRLRNQILNLIYK
ncbi:MULTISPECIES: serine hydrolase domain-containing protein [Candidatus Cardinium]|uniref:serine hydrolase domain-containing protein n=1 Tax=Candidatus Cardinium TaxID=273135 RepID=UPI001FA9A2A0|nr:MULTISPECIES: serine hydrolase domain-containing protein [Cardinium]